MRKAIKYLIAYTMWIANMLLSIWFVYLTRTSVLSIMALFYQQGDFQYTKLVNLVDRVLVIVLGLGWLVFTIITEEYFRSGALKENLPKRFARVAGPLILCIFIVDLSLFWVQGVGEWMRWLILAIELVAGLALVVYSKKHIINKST
jgi:hypothetical protein